MYDTIFDELAESTAELECGLAYCDRHNLSYIGAGIRTELAVRAIRLDAPIARRDYQTRLERLQTAWQRACNRLYVLSAMTDTLEDWVTLSARTRAIEHAMATARLAANLIAMEV